MKTVPPEIPGDGSEEIAALIETLLYTGQRLEQLTGGEVDTVTNRAGQTVLLPRAQDQLRSNESARQAAILDALPTSIALLDGQGKIISVNEAWQRFGRANAAHHPGHGVGVNYMTVCDEARGDDAAEASQAAAGIRAVLNGKLSIYTLEYPCHSPAEQRWFLMTVTPLVGYTSKGVAVMHLNITASKRAENALRKSEEEFHTLAEAMPQIVWITRADGWNIYFNQNWMDYTGLTLEESLGHGWNKPFHPDDQQHAWDAWENATATNGIYSIESRLRRADGTYRWWLVRGVPLLDADGSILKWFGTCTDIHDLKMAGLEIARANGELRESERRFADLLGNVELISVMLDREARITYCNDYLLLLTGWQHEEVIGKSWWDLFVPAEIQDLRHEFFTSLLDNRPEGRHHENEILTRSGKRRLIRWSNSVLHSAEGEVIGTASIGEDITERRRYAQKFKDLLESAPDAMVIVNRESEITLINAQTVKLFGWQPKELLGKKIDLLIPKSYRKKHPDYLNGFFVQPRAREMGSGMDLLGLRKDGTEFPIEVSLSPLETSEGAMVISAIRDVTDRKKDELKLLESERRFTDLLGNVELVSVMFDREERITYCNDYLLRLTGWQAEEVIGRNWFDIFVPKGIAQTKKMILSGLLLGNPEARHHENEILTRSGEHRMIRWSNSALRSAGGDVTGVASIGEDITERKQAEDKLAANDALLKEFIRHTPAAIAMLDTQMRYIQTSERWIQDYKLVGQEIIGKSHYAIFPEISQRWKAIHQRVLAGAIEHCDEDPFLRTDGSTDWLQWEARPWYQSKDKVGGLIFFTQVITERKQAEARIAQLNRVLLVLGSINALIVRVNDRDELFREACNIAVDAGGFRMAMLVVADPVTMLPVSIVSAGKNEELKAEIRNILSSREGMQKTVVGKVIQGNKAVISNDTQKDPRLVFGKLYTEAGVKSMMVLPMVMSGKAMGVFALYASEVKFFQKDEVKLLAELSGNIAFAIDHIDKQERLQYLAYYDVITGLGNRTLFLERVARYLGRADSGGYKLAIGLIDLERFKSINDSLGRTVGDALLKQVAEWFTRKLGDATLIARIDADHFAIVLPEVKADGNLTKLVDNLIVAFLEHPFPLHEVVLRLGIKLGIALFPDDGSDADILFTNAEAALKKAKKTGERYLFHTRQMTASVADKLTLENQLRHAVDNEEFVLHYQPKVNLRSGKVTSAEALIRWNDPNTGGLVPPGRFIPVLEETGLIYDVGRWALRKAIEDNLRWRAAGLATVRIAVNVSPLQLRNINFLDEIRQVTSIDAHAVDGLELEITESVIMNNIELNIATLQGIRDLGVTIAIDDFGTGFSSLSYLAKLPADTLKIDRSFVIDMTAGPAGLALVSTIINLARALKRKVVAEGVETEEQSRLLLLLGCDEMQGYLFSKPVPAEIFEAKFLVPLAINNM